MRQPWTAVIFYFLLWSHPFKDKSDRVSKLMTRVGRGSGRRREVAGDRVANTFMGFTCKIKNFLVDLFF